MSYKAHQAKLDQYGEGKTEALKIQKTLTQNMIEQEDTLQNINESLENFNLKHTDVSRDKQNLRKQVNEIEFLIKLLAQEINFHERAGLKVKAVAAKESEVSQHRDKEESKAIRAVTEDLNQQVNALNNQVKVLQL